MQKNIYSYVIKCSFEISATFLQNWDISSFDTLKPKKYTYYGHFQTVSIKFLKISTNGNINEMVFNKVKSESKKCRVLFNSLISFENN